VRRCLPAIHFCKPPVRDIGIGLELRSRIRSIWGARSTSRTPGALYLVRLAPPASRSASMQALLRARTPSSVPIRYSSAVPRPRHSAVRIRRARIESHLRCLRIHRLGQERKE